MSRISTLLAALCLAAATTAAPADDMSGHKAGHAGPMTGGMTGHMAGPADKAFMQSMQAMQKAMAVPMTGDPDTDFVAMMLPHHEGAVAMAKVELQYGTDPLLRAMAKDIVDSQEKEIVTMKDWQARHAKAAPAKR